MRASYEWLKQLSGIDAPAPEVAERLTGGGIEVEALERWGGFSRIVVAEVRSKKPHPARDSLTLVQVHDGTETVDVVCGAGNVPDPGGRVVLAQVGASFPGGVEIAERKLGGIASRGMLVSERELGIGDDGDGILVLDSLGLDAPAGQSVDEALGLSDIIFTLGLTPNRPDALGHLGLARELAVLFGQPFTDPVVPAPRRLASEGDAGVRAGDHRLDLGALFGEAGSGESSERVDATELLRAALGSARVDVAIHDPVRCPRYGASLVLGCRVAPSPFWARYRLHCLGVRPIHNVVDATNLAMLERGHPLHAFDLARVRGHRIDVRVALEGERLTTLDDVERELTPDDLLICDGAGPVAIAGIMGGANSEIREETEHVLVECAYFDPRSVRRTGRRLGLHTDASHRFERGVDPAGVPAALARATQLLADLGGGVVLPIGLDVCPAPITRVAIRYRPGRASSLLGFETPDDEAARILAGLGCSLDRHDATSWQVEAPTHRPDLGREEDLIEEIARVRGYDLIPTEVPFVRPSNEPMPASIRLGRAMRLAATAAGLDEALTYAFVAPSELAMCRASTDTVPLLNPLSEERSVLRTSLLPGLIVAARHSLRRQVDSIALFEVGRTFHPTEDVLPREQRRLAFIMAGPWGGWLGEARPVDFYDAKGVLEHIFARVFGMLPTWDAQRGLEDAPHLHPRRCASLWIDDERLGTLGELHPDVADAFDLDLRPMVGDLDLEAAARVLERLGVPQAKELPRFPSVTRDIALVVDAAVEAGSLATALRDAGSPWVEGVAAFDLYEGPQVPDGKKSLAFRVVYRDADATLTDRRVDDVHAQLARRATESFGASVR